MHNFIKNYINKISINDIDKFAKANGANLTSLELNIIYKYVKNDWETIIFDNPNEIFKDLKEKLTPNNYEIITTLFNLYKEKFKNYL